MSRRFQLMIAVVLILQPLASTGMAVEPTSIATLAQASKAARPAATFEKAESVANGLVSEHLPELKPVLTSLRKNSDSEYRKAVSDLARASRRIELYRGKDQIAYKLEVNLLQAQTRADLMLAQLQISGSDNAKQKYRVALKNQELAKLQRMQHETVRMEERITKMQAQLARLNTTIQESDVNASF